MPNYNKIIKYVEHLPNKFLQPGSVLPHRQTFQAIIVIFKPKFKSTPKQPTKTVEIVVKKH